VILPFGIFIALVWLLAWITNAWLEDDGSMAGVGFIGYVAIMLTSWLIQINWPVAAQCAEAIPK
jgi:hypothetical protein